MMLQYLVQCVIPAANVAGFEVCQKQENSISFSNKDDESRDFSVVINNSTGHDVLEVHNNSLMSPRSVVLEKSLHHEQRQQYVLMAIFDSILKTSKLY